MKVIITAIYRFLTNRLFILFIFVIAMFYIILTALFKLQIVEGDEKARDFELSVIREVEIEGQRGNIYDRNGYPLAENVIAYDLLLNDSVEVSDKNKMIHQLISIVQDNGDEVVNDFPLKLTEEGLIIEGSEKQILNFKKNVYNRRYTEQLKEEEVAATPLEVFTYMRDRLFEVDKSLYTTQEILDILNVRYMQYIKRYSKYQPETIAVNVSQETLADVEERKDIFPGVSILESPYRVYNDAPYFAHIIGYTREIDSETLELLKPLGYDSNDKVGVIGIEEEMELQLRGYDGYQKVEVNNLGKTMLVLEDVEPVMGNDVYLTIDHDLQIETYHILEQNLANILVDKLMMQLPNTKDQRYVLLKDVYDSIFRYNLIDVSSIPGVGSEASENIYVKMQDVKSTMTDRLIANLQSDGIARDYDKDQSLYKYVFETMVDDGVLDKSYDEVEIFDQYMSGDVDFQGLIIAYLEQDLLMLSDDYGMDNIDGTIDFMTSYIINDLLLRYDLTEYMYLYCLDEEMFSYYDLTHLIVEMELVTATEEQLSNLDRRRLSPLNFMKEKITNIEITPQQLALDPSSGAVVITDVDTGEVLALVSYPTYDNSRLVNNFDNAYYYELLNDPTSPLFPRATHTRTAPGSTFKMVTAMAALDMGVITPTQTVFAEGKFDKIWPAAKCWIYDHGGIHGSINVSQAIEVSCNYFFYEMGYRLSITESGGYSDAQGLTTLEEYASKFGLDSKTGIEIGELSSTLATHDAVRASIGQSDNSYTPVQLARYMNTLANDGLMRELNIVDKVKSKVGDLVEDYTPEILRKNDFDPAYLKAVKDGMVAVTSGSSGTARAYFADLPIKIAGKTGTAELIKTRANHAVFTGFAPYEDPEISVVTVIPFGYASKYAALTANKVFRNYFGIDDEVESFTMNHEIY